MYKIFEVYNRPSEMETQINQLERDGYRLQSLTLRWLTAKSGLTQCGIEEPLTSSIPPRDA